MLSRRYATLVETQTMLGVQDIYDLIEIIAIDHHNDNLKLRE